MTSKPKQDRGWLLAIGKAVARQLRQRCEGTGLRIRMATGTGTTNTGGWSVSIGGLGHNKPKLQIWLDRFSGYPQRKLWAGFASYNDRKPILDITRRVSRQLWPMRAVTAKDLADGESLRLADRLARSEFNVPVLERYEAGRTFYGIYDPTRSTGHRGSPHFCTRALAFFEDVARALPYASDGEEQRDVYPQIENRKRVVSHLHRERSRLLTAECKIRDGYKCRACGLRFEDAYGRLGAAFAEAHHLVPLSRLREDVRTRVEDLVTVCSNCHRMLHRMQGKRDDLSRLKVIIRRRCA